MNWLTASFAVIALGACWYFHLVDEAQREHDAMVDREEEKIRDDAKRMRKWYRERQINVEGDTEAEIAAVFMDMAARG